jgi:hypothetical protein
LGVDGCLGQEPSNNAIEQTNGETRFVTPFAAHRERSADIAQHEGSANQLSENR